ncbi:hypothetical protein [Nonomuraea candida]|uniref:hypothetical protein n=1 Tax=Nonomuraea candida TaxID=359159 RepID=UPI0005BB5910|nr:hypothetical protein [Nonomuraea candida]
MTATEQAAAVAGPPRGRGRRAGRRPGAGSRLLNAVAGLVLVGGAIGLQTFDMSEGEASDALRYGGSVGEDVDARRFTVRVDSFSAARSIESHTDTIGTDHLFLIVNASAKSSLKPYHLGPATLVTADGKKFAATDRVDRAVTLARAWVQPDIWVSGRFVFEVPVSALAGASVVIGLPPAGISEAYLPEVEVDLGLDEAGARRLAASAQDVYSVKK